MSKQQNRFNFFIPLEFEKSSDEKGGELVKIKGICSTDAEDSDGEVLIPSGFDFKPLLQTGFLNWNHQAKNTASAICGEPTKAEVVDGGKALYIEGFLYPNAEGKRIAELAQTLDSYSTTRRLGFSIEGQALERDVLNPKKVLKARITGVAITQSPKNPKTLLDIVKGEYDDDFNDEEEDEKEVDKAMVVNTDINPESVEGAEKDKIVGEELKKSYIYNKIHSKYTKDFEKADKIYDFIKQVSEQKMKNNKITAEVLEKAFDLLDESIALVKSEEQKSLDDYDKKDEVEENFDKGDEEVEDDEEIDEEVEEVEKGEDLDDEEVEDDEDEAFEKAMAVEDIAKSLFNQGLKKGEVVQRLTSVGVNLRLAEMSCRNCIVQLSEEDIQGGKITSLSKGETNELGVVGVDALSSIRTILKANADQISELTKSQIDLTNQLRELRQVPNARKSAMSSRAVERFEKSKDGVTVYDSRNPHDMANLSNRLFDEVSLLKSRGENDSMLEKAVSDLEIAKSTDFRRIQNRLNGLGIQVI